MKGVESVVLDSEKFKIALARNSMNVADLALKSDVSSNTINSWMKTTGRRNPTTKAIGKISTALGVDVTEIIEN